VVCDALDGAGAAPYHVQWSHIVTRGRSPSANVSTPRNEGWEHLQPAFKVAHLAAGGAF